MFYPEEDIDARLARTRSCETRRARRAASRTRAGACARTARGSGPTSSSPRCATRTATLVGFAKVTRDLTSASAPRSSCGQTRGAERREREQRSACWCRRARLRDLHARPRRPRRDLERGRRAHQGLPRGRDHRPALLELFYPTRTRAPAAPGRRAADRRARGPLRGGGLARAQGRHALLGQRRDHGAARRHTAAWSASPRSRATSPSAARRSSSSRSQSARPAWRRSASTAAGPRWRA